MSLAHGRPLPLELSREWVEAIRTDLPELPDERERRLMDRFGVPAYDARFMTQSKAHGDYFEAVMEYFDDGKAASNWMMGELAALLNAESIDIKDSPVGPAALARMLKLVKEGTISGKMAKQVFEEMFATGNSADQIVEAKGLRQVSDPGEIAVLVDTVLAANPGAVEEYRSGKKQAFGFLVGQCMAASRGHANPALVNQVLHEKLEKK